MAYYEIYLYNNDDPRILIASSDYNPGILNPVVEKEVNTSGSLSFNVLPSHPQHDEFYRFKTRLDVVINDQVIFRGRVTSIAEDFYKQKSIECEGALGYLNDTLYKVESGSVSDFNKKSIKLYDTVFGFLSQLSRIRDENLDTWKVIELGNYENIGSENLCNNSKIIEGFFDRDNAYTRTKASSAASSIAYSTDFIEASDTLLYYLSLNDEAPSFRDAWGGLWRVNFYDENKDFLPFLRSSWGVDRNITLNPWTLPDGTTPYAFGRFSVKDFWDPDNNIRKISKKPTYFRISVAGYMTISVLDGSQVLWIQYVDNEANTHTFNDYVEVNTYDTWSNTLSSACIEGRTNFIRTRVYRDKIYLDYLNGNRTVYDDCKEGSYSAPNAHEMEYSVNIMDMSFDDAGIEPYSCIVPISNGIGYIDESGERSGYPYVYVENEKAVELYGYIHKPLDVGSADGAQISKKTALKRAEKYMKLYDPMIPDSITIKALDKGVFFDTEKFQMIDIGDAVHVVSEPHGIDKSLICLSLKFDIMNPQNNEYKIGRYIPEGDDYKIKNLTDSFAKSKKK